MHHSSGLWCQDRLCQLFQHACYASLTCSKPRAKHCSGPRHSSPNHKSPHTPESLASWRHENSTEMNDLSFWRSPEEAWDLGFAGRRMDIPRIMHRPAPWDAAWDHVKSTIFFWYLALKCIQCPRLRNALRCNREAFGQSLRTAARNLSCLERTLC